MSHDIRRDIRRRCQRAGIPFATVEETYQELRVMHRKSRRRGWEMRQRAWEAMTSRGNHLFWRHGWQVRYRYAFTEGDHACIRGFDSVVQTVAHDFPELRENADLCQALYDFLMQPHDRMPTAEETWQEAADIVLGNVAESISECVPF